MLQYLQHEDDIQPLHLFLEAALPIKTAQPTVVLFLLFLQPAKINPAFPAYSVDQMGSDNVYTAACRFCP
jgi:hypothetical protein